MARWLANDLPVVSATGTVTSATQASSVLLLSPRRSGLSMDVTGVPNGSCAALPGPRRHRARAQKNTPKEH